MQRVGLGGKKAILWREILLTVPSRSAVGLHLRHDVNWCKLLHLAGPIKVYYLACLADSSLLRDFSKVPGDCLFWIRFRRGALVFLKKWFMLSSSLNSWVKTGSVLKQRGSCCWWFRSCSFPCHLAAHHFGFPLSFPCWQQQHWRMLRCPDFFQCCRCSSEVPRGEAPSSEGWGECVCVLGAVLGTCVHTHTHYIRTADASCMEVLWSWATYNTRGDSYFCLLLTPSFNQGRTTAAQQGVTSDTHLNPPGPSQPRLQAAPLRGVAL